MVVLQRQASAARNQVTTAQTQAGVVGANIPLAELAVKQARANVENARLQLSYTIITAPTAGVVSDKSIQLGQVVAAGHVTMLKVADDRRKPGSSPTSRKPRWPICAWVSRWK